MSTHAMIYLRLKDSDKNKTYKTKFGNLKIGNEDTIGIYCHHDGYEDGVGAELLDNFNSYEDAFNLIKNGNTSYIEGDDIGFYSEYEDFEDNKPFQMDTDDFESYEYQYLFENGKWKIWNYETENFETYGKDF